MLKINTLRFCANAYVALVWYWITDKRRTYWLIGGHNGSLYTDNAKAFHAYILEKHPDIDIHWVVNSKAPALNQIPGNLLIKGSVKSYLYFFRARVALFSNTFNSDIAPLIFVLPIIRANYCKCFKVYLGHGTIGFKKMVEPASYLRKFKLAVFASYDLAIAATMLEVEAMKRYGIKESAIVLAGSARHDNLVSLDSERDFILIAPTWRIWINNQNELINSTYLANYKRLLTNSRLKQFLQNQQIYVEFYLHHMFNKFHHEFASCQSEYISILQTDVDISDRIKKAKLMVTDYSSVSSDFYFLQKPIVFFQFDRDEYLDMVGSEISLRSATFGDVSFDLESLVGKIIESASLGFPTTELQKQGEQFFINYKDGSNCERIYDYIQQRL